uniref:DUF4216 domain-containing protein n=1 Tax=Brassica oleracea var. oleracea TaxID=109376 RepID=A0A0D3E6R7_BRAOL
MLTYVSTGMTKGETFNDWIREMVRGPEYVVKSYPRFCTRGYAFTTQKRRRSSTSYDAGVCSASGDDVYYGNIRDIMEIKHPGMVGLRCTVFYCDWYDNTPDRDPLQPSTSGNLSAAEDLAAVGLVVDLTDFGEEAAVHVEDEPEIGEFHQDPDSDSSGLLVIRPGLDLVVPHHEVLVVRGATLRVRPATLGVCPATLGCRAATVGILHFPLRFLLPLLHPLPSRCCTPSRSSSRSVSDDCCPVGSAAR